MKVFSLIIAKNKFINKNIFIGCPHYSKEGKQVPKVCHTLANLGVLLHTGGMGGAANTTHY